MKRIIIVILIFSAASAIHFGIKLHTYYTPASECVPYAIAHNNSDTIRIAYIGDSWAFMHLPYDSILPERMSNATHRPVIVTSFGICGLTSKEIYELFFFNKEMKEFMMKGYGYCFISAGINDTYKKMSKKYYATNIDYTIKFLLSNNVRPIILEIPDYDIEKAYEGLAITQKLKNRLSMLINGTSLDCKEEFRTTLNCLIQGNGYSKQVDIIRYKEWNSDFRYDQERLYQEDGMHLNEQGYNALDSCILKTICSGLCDDE